MSSACCHHDHAAASATASARYRRVLWLALLINAAMFAAELIGGMRAGSVALLADALDFFGDAANYAISLLVLGLALSWRARAAWLKGFSMGLFGLFVLGRAVWAASTGQMPQPLAMGAIGALALLANLATAVLLYAWRDGDANMRSVWLCTRNDAIGNVAVLLAALGVFGTASAWPDLAVAAVMGTLALLAAAAAVALLYRRVRRTRRQLVSSQQALRTQSERDPLTHLANRRHFLSVMQTTRALGGSGFEGALLLVDIDHFKHVNDGHGHAAGDLVLCEVARRLSEAVRRDDLVVRWGGEEFLVLALQVPAEQAEQLAERVVGHIGRRPVVVQGKPVQVTVSVGYARFPLPPHVLPVGWEQAINLADMALYTAKNQGRNRAVGIVAAQAQSAPELRHIEGDFDRAWHEGRVTLKVAPGPLALAA